ncbi:MAG: coenzyme F420-0:L-glutamate ligase [Candidatus Thorarchaeota archaeon]|nr:coenzyme F420-0:L-glutamate ligase [Candidatus Thorarchaeota archaeon]
MRPTQMPNNPSEESNSQNNLSTIEVIPVIGLPKIKPGDNLAELILQTMNKNKQNLRIGDVLVIAHTVVSIAEGAIIQSADIVVSPKAEKIALANERKPQKIQTAINEAQDIIREEPVLITRTRHGLITDMSGVDESNAPVGYYVLLPENPDHSADMICRALSEIMGFEIPVIIADTQGRPWRKGAVNLAIGLAGISPFTVNAGLKDLYGHELRSSLVCIADELAAAAELIMGQADEGIPAAIIRGLDLQHEEGSATQIIRSENENLFN